MVTLANRLVDLKHIGTKAGTALVVLILRSEWAHEIMDGASRRARSVARNPRAFQGESDSQPRRKKLKIRGQRATKANSSCKSRHNWPRAGAVTAGS